MLHKEPIVISINAISGGGKTTVIKAIQSRLRNSKALYFDDRDYDVESGIIDICKWVENGADVNLFNLQTLADDISLIIQEDVDYIFLDYPFGYKHKQIGKFINFSVFLDTPLDIALARRTLRDYKQEPTAKILKDMEFYLVRERSVYIHSLESAKADADFIVDGSLRLDDVVEIILKRLHDVKR